MANFQPTRPDGRSYRDVAVDALKTIDYGAVLSYTDLGKYLDLHPVRNKQEIQVTLREANTVLLKQHKRGLKNVRKVGYRVIEPREHMLVANDHQTKADRAMVRALRFYDGADLTRMSEAERRLHHGQQMLAQAIFASHQHLDRRIRKIEDLLKGTQTISE